MFLDGRTILGLPRKADNANTTEGLLKKSSNAVANAEWHWLQKKYKKRLHPVEVAAVL